MLTHRLTLPMLLVALAAALSGCSSDKPKPTAKLDPFAGKGSPYYKGKGPVPRGGGRYHVGKAYQVAGRWYMPREQPDYDETGLASWYGEAFNRRMTSNGEYFDMGMLSAAHPTLPLPSYAKVTNLENGRSIVVRINDRGPFVGNRLIDLSKRSADVLGFRQQGKAEVRVQYLGRAPLNDQGAHLAMMNKKLRQGASVRQLMAAARGKDDKRQLAAVETSRENNRVTHVSNAAPELDVAFGSSYVVHVGEFSNPANALAAENALAEAGPGQVHQVAAGLYVLRLGPFASKMMAQQAHAAVLAAGFPESRLIRIKLQPTGEEF